MNWTIVQLSPKPQMSEHKSSTLCVVIERPDHHCRDDLVHFWHILWYNRRNCHLCASHHPSRAKRCAAQPENCSRRFPRNSEGSVLGWSQTQNWNVWCFDNAFKGLCDCLIRYLASNDNDNAASTIGYCLICLIAGTTSNESQLKLSNLAFRLTHQLVGFFFVCLI